MTGQYLRGVGEGQVYEHQGGRKFQVMALAMDEGSGGYLVIHKGLHDGRVWSMGLGNFTGTLEGVPKFRLLPVIAAGDVFLNSPEDLPPVDCPLLIEVEGLLMRASRTGFIEQKDREMEYRLDDGQLLSGRYRWTYP